MRRRRAVPPSVKVDRRRLLAMTWPLAGIVIVLVFLAVASLDMLSALRAFVGGESLWSKAQKEAVTQLERYIRSRDDADYAAYLRAIDVTIGPRIARVELEKSYPDFELARDGLLRGRNHPEDVPGMMRMFRRFRRVAEVDHAIAIWADADAAIAVLKQLGDEIRAHVARGEPADYDLDVARDRLRAIDRRLNGLEESFTSALGAASRRARQLLDGSIVAIAIVLALFGILRTRRMLAQSGRFERALRTSEERFQRAVRGSSDGLWEWQRHASALYVSPRFRELAGMDTDAVATPAYVLARLHTQDRQTTQHALRLHLRRGVPFDCEFRVRSRAGEWHWLRGRGHAERDARGRVLRVSGSIGDITDRKAAEAQLFAEKERAQVTLESIGDAVIATDIEGSIEYLNPVAEVLTGWSSSQACGLPLAQVCHIIDETTQQPVRDAVQAVLREGGTVTLGTRLLLERRQGGRTPIDETATPIRDRNGQIDGVVLVFRDVSRERHYSAALSYQASHDLLTGLVNRHEFESRLDVALGHAAQASRPCSVLYLDLDQFKVVNDTSGHAAGDELLRQVGALLQSAVREGDTVARLGGDEFAVLLDGCAPEHALSVANKLRQGIADHHFICGRRSFALGVSIGMVNLDDDPRTRDEVLSLADSACYVAKEKGRNRIHVYRADDVDLSVRQGEMAWVERLHRALDDGLFCLYRQEIVPLTARDGGSHFEILLRLRERGELIPPMAFIPAAERYGLMPLIDRWVIRKAFTALRRMQAEPGVLPVETCAINLSGASLGDDDLARYVRHQLEAVGVEPHRICFEITETAAISNLARASEFMHELKRIGCRFSLDDFGAGMSSFAYLKNLPVDFVKIDGGFVRDMRHDPIDRAMVEAIHRVGNVMGKATIAECVEDAATLQIVRDVGIDYAQGYGISVPRPLGTALKWTDTTDTRPNV